MAYRRDGSVFEPKLGVPYRILGYRSYCGSVGSKHEISTDPDAVYPWKVGEVIVGESKPRAGHLVRFYRHESDVGTLNSWVMYDYYLEEVDGKELEESLWV